MQPPTRSLFTDRLRFSLYGMAAGLFVGLFLGWMFHGFVGLVVRLFIVLVILVPLAVAVFFWLKVNQQNAEERSAVQEADWREPTGPR